MACARHLPLLLAVLLLAACGGEQRLPQAELTGGTMGTTFRIVLVDAPAGHDLDAQLERVMATLDRVDALASTWRADSELTAFNDALITDWVDVSPAFCGVLQDALAASVASGGAFDVTVGPLVNLWGFGPGGEIDSPPTDAEIAATRERVGYEKLETDCDQARIRKAVERLYVDLSGWAKGYAVDEVAALLDSDGLTNYMVEIGGELKVQGHNAERRRWAIAVEAPSTSQRVPQAVLRLTDTGVATSGDYRNYFTHDGAHYSHTIDPRSGRPVAHALAAVTVVDPSTAYADAMATALLVLGPDEAPALAKELGIAGYFLIRNETGILEITTPAFDALSTP